MYKDLLNLLEKATGRSEHVIAINLDIRNFTGFCQSVDSLDVATYIKKIYQKIISNYFRNACFYKPTGDGLIIIMPYNEEELKEVVISTITYCLALLEEFSSLCAKEHMINYLTPQKIGIGLTRGSACCIHSNDKILDYSGRILNLASRLMDLARPSGIVFDDSFGINLLSDEIKELFTEEMVYVRGVAEEKPIKIHYTKKHTLIPDSYKHPLKEPKWNTDTKHISFGKLKKLGGKLWIDLGKKPLDENKITVKVVYDNPNVEGFQLFNEYSIDDDAIEYGHRGNTHRVAIDLDTLNKEIEEQGVTEDMDVQIDVTYPIK